MNEQERVIREWRTADKGEWGAGPWQDEPDKVQWVDAETGLDCLIVRNSMGALCGYVGVPETHSLHGKPYGDRDFDVHGGLTFSDGCDEEAVAGEGICHIPEPGRPDKVWWFGFDCAHGFDQCPSYRNLGLNSFGHGTYKTRAYVERECTSLARQLFAVL